MNSQLIYLIDGTLEALLTAVFEWFERKPGEVQLKLETTFQPDAFSSVLKIDCNREKADRVWKGLQKKLDYAWMRKLYCAYLSEKPEVLESIFHFTCYIFNNEHGSEKNYGNKHVLAIAQMATKVEREKHRTEAFIRFQHTAEGVFYCGIDPDFNILPLITTHFRDRYADQQWIIYDLKRQYGIHYDLYHLEEITLTQQSSQQHNLENHQLNESEKLYQYLWRDYFKSTNIVARKNTKLHVKHVPKRYWKYLTEKLEEH